MGPKQSPEVALFFAKDGQFEKVESVKEFPEFQSETADATGLHYCSFLRTEGAEFKGKLTFGKPFRCKSRKRFVKLLMSKGMGRDEAERNAKVFREIGLSYSDAWFRLAILGGGW